MIDIKVKTKDKNFTVPIPYTILNLGISVLSSKTITRLINSRTKKAMNDKEINFTIPQIDKRLLKQLIGELKNHKGTDLVHVKSKDGSEITIKL
ncbi:hypothetical protein [Neobacillus sp. D3-1R]|uniref:hypothetical protein n=1 Tax=Neobacillus sp. D3-1R TaxID=3445778 RepID=UPI003FA00060